MDNRSVSPIIGVILLIGMASAVSVTLLFVGGSILDSKQQQAETEQVEQSFIRISEQIETSSKNTDVSKTTNLDAGERGAITHRDKAKYKIWSEAYNGTNKTNIGSGTIGTVEYESDDGTRIAYEGGGVFRDTGEQTQIVSAPSVTYDRETDTLNYPVTQISEGKELRSGNLKIEKINSTVANTSYVKQDHVFIEIESAYCEGWQQYFKNQAGDTAVKEACYDGENDDGEVKIKLGYEDIEDAFESGLSVPDSGNYEPPNGNNANVEMSEGKFPPINSVIDSLGDELEGSPDLQSPETNDAGEYYVENMNDEYDFNLSDGDAIVYVNNSVSPEKIDIKNCGSSDNSLKIYAQGDFNLENDIGESCPDDSVETIQLYGTDSSSVDFQDSSSTFKGLIYVAGDTDEFDPDHGGEYQVKVGGGGNVDMHGSIIAQSVEFQSAANSVNLQGSEDSDVTVIPAGHEPAPQLMYLNIVEEVIDIENR